MANYSLASKPLSTIETLMIEKVHLGGILCLLCDLAFQTLWIEMVIALTLSVSNLMVSI